MAFRRLRRAFRKVKAAVTKAVDVVSDIIEFTFTGALDGTEGADALTAIGFGGTVRAKGGDDAVTAGAAALKIEDTTGDLDVHGAAGRLDVRKTGAGDVTFIGAAGVADIRTRGSIDFTGAAFANHLETVSNDAKLTFKGAGGSNTLKGQAATISANSRIDVDFTGAGIANSIETSAAWSAVRFVGAGASNKIAVTADHADVSFAGGGGANHITVGAVAGKVDSAQIAALDALEAVRAEAAAAAAEVAALEAAGNAAITGMIFGATEEEREAAGEAFEQAFLGLDAARPALRALEAEVAAQEAALAAIGERSLVSEAKVSFTGAGADNVVEVGSNDIDIDFAGAGLRNRVAAVGYGADSTADLTFVGAGAYTDIDAIADRARVSFAGAGVSNDIFVQSDDGEVAFKGVGASNAVEVIAEHEDRDDTRAHVTFEGGGGGNFVGVEAADASISFTGVGLYNEITAQGLGAGGQARIEFTGGGGYNLIEAEADRGLVRFAGAGGWNKIRFETTDGDIHFTGAGVGNDVQLRRKEGAADDTRGDIVFTGGGGANIVKSSLAHGDIHFTGLGLGNVVARYGAGEASTGDIVFAGGGGANIVSSSVRTGRIVFTGVGAANVITRASAAADASGDVVFTGGGGANLVKSTVLHGDLIFAGAGAANVITRRAGAGSTGDVIFTGVGVGNVVEHRTETGDTVFTGGGGANVITRVGKTGDVRFTGIGAANVISRRGYEGSDGDVIFVGAGFANVITHYTKHGDIDFTGGGGGNKITRVGETGDVTFAGIGLANIVHHRTDHGHTWFLGGGGGNSVLRRGETGGLHFEGAGLANVINHDVAAGDMHVRALGGGNVVHRRGAGHADVVLGGGANYFKAWMGRGVGLSTVDAQMAGVANILHTDVTGKTTALMVGRANIATIRGEADITAIGDVNVINTGAHADRIRSYGIANVITTSGDNNDIQSYGAFSIIRDGGEDATLSQNEGDGPLLVDLIAGATDALVDTTVDAIAGEGEGRDLFSDPSIYLDAIEDAVALADAAAVEGAAGGDEAGAYGIETPDAPDDQALIEAELAARGLTEADLEGGVVVDDGPAGAWSSLSEGDLAQRAAPGAGADAAAEAGATPDAAALSATLDAALEAELAQHSGALEQAQRATDDVIAEREAEGQDHAGEAEEEEDDGSTIGDGPDIPGALDDAEDVEDDDFGGVGGLGGGGIEWAGKKNFNVALLAGLFNVVKLGSKDDVVFAASLGNYISTGAGNDVAMMLGAANVFLGGDGRDVAIQAAFGNVALMGGGDHDVAVQIGATNFVNKDGNGKLYAFQFGANNIVYHGGMKPGESADREGNLVAVMAGHLNIAHKQGDGGGVTGVLLGAMNSLSHKGDGRFVGVMVGAANVATKIGGGDAWFFMGGSLNVATHVNASGEDSLTFFVMAGAANVATSVGDGLMIGLFLGQGNVVTRVGNGDVYAAMIGLSGNVLTVVNSAESALVAAVGGRVNAVTKVGDGLLAAVGYAGIANVVTHVGDGTMVVIEVGKLNVITKVGDSGIDGEDGATVMAAAGHLNVLTHVGDGSTVLVADGILNVATKVGDGAAAAVLSGQANVAVHVGDGMMLGLSVSTARFVPGASKAKKVNAAGRLTSSLDTGGAEDRDALDIGAIAQEGAAPAQDGGDAPSRWDRISGAFADQIYGDAFARDVDALNGSVSTAYAKVRAKLSGGAGAPDVGQAAAEVGAMAQQVQDAGDVGPDLGQTGGPGFSANIGAKFGDGDVYFIQAGLDMKDARGRRNDSSPSEGEAGDQLRDGAGERGSGDSLDAMFRGLNFDYSANIFFRLGDGRTAVVQRGSMNLVANWVDRLDADGRAVQGYAEDGPDYGAGFDFVHLAWGDLNVSVDVSLDQLFVAGGLDGVAKLDAQGAPKTGRGRDALSVMMGSTNVSVKIGDGANTRAMLGDANLGVTIGNGTDNAIAIGQGNLLVRVGSVIAGDDDNNYGGRAFGGFKAVVGNGNAIIDYGRSDGVFVAGAYSRPVDTSSDTESDTGSDAASGTASQRSDDEPAGNVVARALNAQLTYLKSFGPAKGAGKFDRFTALRAAGGLAGLALFGKVATGIANHGEEPGKNHSQFAKRSGSNQTNTIFGFFGTLGRSLHTRGKTGKWPERDVVDPDVKRLSRNAGTYNSSYNLNRQIEEISVAYFKGLNNGGNIVHAGAGADVVLTVGAGNLVFGDNITSLLTDFSFAAFFPAHAQALSLNEIVAMLRNEKKLKAGEIADDPQALAAAEAAYAKRAHSRRLDAFSDRLIEGVELMQTFVDVGATIPYQSFGDMLNYGYNPDGSITGYGADGEAIAGQLLNVFWVDLTLPSSVFGGVVFKDLASAINDASGREVFDMAGTMMNGFLSPDEAETDAAGSGEDAGAGDDDAIAALEEFMIGTDAEGNGKIDGLYTNAGIPVIPGIPNFESLMETVLNFRDVVALGEGGPLDGLRNIGEKLDVLEGDGDVLVALGGGNMQFGGHGDDIMATMGKVSHNFGGYGDDLIVSIGQYSHLNGNDGDDYLIAAGQYNVLHDGAGHNTVIAIGDRNDVRLGRGNDAIFVLGNKSKARGGSGYNFITALGAKNSIYLAGNDVVFAVGGDNNYYLLGGAGSRALIQNLGAAHVTLSPGVKAYVNAAGGDISGSAGDDFLMFTRDYESGVILTDSDAGTEELRRQAELDPAAYGAAWQALQDRGITSQKDTVIMRGRDTVVFGGGGGSADKDLYVLGYGLKDGVLVDVAGERLGFDGETEDKIVIGERVGVADYSADLVDAPVIFRRDGDDLLILSPDHVVHHDAPGPLDADGMNSVRVKDYFNTLASHGAQVVLSVWDANEGGVAQQWREAYDAEEAEAAEAAQTIRDLLGLDEGADSPILEQLGTSGAIHTWDDFDFSDYTYVDRDGIKALIAAHEALRAAPGGADLSEREVWAQVWAGEFDGDGGVVKSGDGLSNYKLSTRDGLILTGGAGDDLVEGAQLGDVIEGGAGDDVLRGAEGDDIFIGDLGNDVIEGGEGVDAVDYVKIDAGGVIVDLAAGTAAYALDGRDWVDGLTGIEEVRGSARIDRFYGSESDDRLFGAGGDDIIYGYGGDDWLDGGTGANWLYGGDGDDTIALSGDLSQDAPLGLITGKIDGGAGSDTVDASALTRGVVVDLSAERVRAGDDELSFVGIENVTGSDFDDVIVGGVGVNVLKGGAGNDRFAGALSGDDLDGGDGWDALDLSAGAAALRVDLGAGLFAVEGEPDGAVAGIEEVRGGSGDDVIAGAAGVSETLSGGLGVNVLTGNEGDGDVASYAGAAGPVSVDLGLGAATGAGFSDTLHGIEAVRGSAFDDVLIAGDAAVVFDGGDGDDVLTGGAGDDVFVGGAGADVIAGGDGVDVVDYGADPDAAPVLADLSAGTATQGGEEDALSGVENLAGSAGNDVLSGDAGANALWGWEGDDALDGRDGDDSLFGEAGNDTLRGGLGDDALEGGAGNDALFGDAGDDALFGGDGDDVLHGGPGADVLVGGAGDDRYVVFGGAGTTRIEAEDGYDLDGERYMTSMDADSRDVLQVGEDGEGFTHQDVWFSRSGDDLLLEVLGEGGDALSAHTLSNWYLAGEDAATRMDAFEAGDRVMEGGGVAQLVEAMAAWTADAGLDENRREALREDAGLTGQLAAVWQPTLQGGAAGAAV